MQTIAGYHPIQKLFESHNTVILRGQHSATGKMVMLKLLKGEHPKNERINRFRYEYSLLSSFDSESIIKTYGLENHQDTLVIVLEDCFADHDLLSEVIQNDTFTLEQFLGIAVEISQTLSIIHDSHIIYRNCNPTGILISKDRNHVKFIDFRIATDERRPSSRTTDIPLPNAILPYISPEQTGRIEQAVDYRSDLYSLGITLFQLATGNLPFKAHNVGELVHAHLARKPPAPDELNRALPKVVSAIILRLLEKIPERRFQTCQGLVHDLKHCLQQLREQCTVADFRLGLHDAFRTVELPAYLSHRNKELQTLEEKLEEAIGGERAAVFLSGEEGIGKSSLVQEFTARMVRKATYCLAAKCSPAATPHSPLNTVVRQLVRLILSEDHNSIRHRQELILEALGNESSALTTAFPETEQLLGPQGQPNPLAPEASNYRHCRVLGKFFKACCETGPVLVLFLDDLHHAETTLLDQLHYILSSARIRRFLFLGAYRKKDSVENAPLQTFLSALASTHPNVHHLHLENLLLPDIAELLATSLLRNRREIGELAAICLQKTGGNPYFLRQFLLSANQQGHLAFSRLTQRWEWDITGLKASQITSNRAEFARKKIPSVPAATTALLRTAACLGDSCSLELVTALLGHRPEHELAQLFREGLMFTTVNEQTTTLHFAHTHIREEILLPLSLDERSAIRLRAGRHLLYTLAPEEYFSRIQEIADYLAGDNVRRISSRTEMLDIARVQLDAGRESLNREIFHKAHLSFIAGIAALPDGSWETDYSLCLALYTNGCRTGLQVGDHIVMENCFNEVCTRAVQISDSFQVYRFRIKALKARGKPEQAVATALSILRMLGVTLPTDPTPTRSLLAIFTTRVRLLPYNDDRLARLPEMSDPTALATMGFLHETATAAYATTPRLLPLLAEHAIRLTLRYGQCPDSYLIGYITYGFLLCSLSTRMIDEGYRFGHLALTFDNKTSKTAGFSQIHFTYNNFIGHWKGHVRDTLPPLNESVNEYFHPGNLTSTTYAACATCVGHYLTGTNLGRLVSRINEHLELVKPLNQQLAGRRLRVIAGAVAALQGKTADPTVFSESSFDETQMLELCLQTGDRTTYSLALVMKMVHAVLFHDNVRAIYFSNKARPYLKSLTASALLPVFYFYDSLARLATYWQQSLTEKLHTRLVVARQQNKMRRWARHAPQNYTHKYLLVEAERQRVIRTGEHAMELYDNAIHLAHEHQYINEEALAYELAARFYNDRKKTHIARLYLREARYCYYRWGATAKISRLDSHETVSSTSVLPWSSPPTTIAPGEGASRLDMLTVIKASRILSSEMVLGELLKKMMRIMLESGGAQKGALIFKEESEWLIKVWGTTSKKAIISLTHVPVNSQNIASKAIVNYVAHTGRDVVLDDASQDGSFINDNYVIENKTRSILCMPILHQSDIFCILYLENNLATGTFPPDRQELLQLLGVQSAISLKNAMLFEELEHTVGRLNLEIDKRQKTQQQLLHAEKLSALGRLSASIAHEFGNPLMGVKYLLDDFHKREYLSDGDRQLLELGLEECNRMKTLIRDLQRLNKPSSGKKSVTDIHQLIEHVLLFQKKHFSSNRIKLQTIFDRSLPQVEIIIDQITQVLFNLTMNAVDAMALEGGVMTVATRLGKGDIIIEINDTGSGIAAEHQERVFEPFFSTKKEEDGTGLGLSISYGIAHHHGGNLSFVSEPDRGTTFTLTIPLRPEDVYVETAVIEEMKN